jgi:hypothetical protein
MKWENKPGVMDPVATSITVCPDDVLAFENIA